MSEIRRSGFILAAFFAASMVLSFTWKSPVAAKFDAISENMVPISVDGFSGKRASVPITTLQALESAQLVNREYTSPDGFDVGFALVGGTDRDALHDPRSCLTGAGGRIDNDRVETLRPAGLSVRSCDVLYGNADSLIEDIVYFYFTRQGSIASATDIRLRLLSSALLLQRPEPIYFLRFVTPVPTGATFEERRQVHARLLAFASRMWGVLGPKLAGRMNHL